MIKKDKLKSLEILQILYQNQEINTKQKNEITGCLQGKNDISTSKAILKNLLYVSSFKDRVRELLSYIEKEENNVC